MEGYTFVLCCAIFAAAAAFTIPNEVTENSLNGVLSYSACKCKNGRCVTDNRGKTKCNCPPGYALQDEATCGRCDCGKKGRCMFIPHPQSAGGLMYEKKCLCDLGSAEKDGECIDCHCGEHSKCEFEGDEKICYCLENFSEKEGVCTECNCGFYGECKFEYGEKKCTCDVGFAENSGTCEECDCGENSLACTFRDGMKNCTCKSDVIKRAQYEGICVDCHCGSETSDGCRFVGERKICQCIGGYVQRGLTCKKKCSSDLVCQNGGHCRHDGICNCPKGTSGDFCEIIDNCDQLCPQSPDIKCVYDPEEFRAYCQCTDEYKAYHPIKKECRPKCMDDRQCGNGGKCVEQGYSRFCNCLEGTEGDFCEIVPECRTKNCGEDAECVYDTRKESVVCKCKELELEFDQEDLICKRTCDSPSDCENGGVCAQNGIFHFCRCLDGTTGDFCERVPGCKVKDCGDSAKCIYDIEKRIAACVCNDENQAFDPVDFKCKRTCHDDSDCQNGAKCSERGFCDCLLGTEGDFCENIVGCDAKDCGNHARCVFDTSKKSAVCECHDKNLSFDNADKTCKKTCQDSSDCRNGAKCTGEESSKFCRCLIGTSGDFCERVKECDFKDCGREAKCLFEVSTKSAICKCEDGRLSFDVRDKTCKRECQHPSDCFNGAACKREESSSFCECLEGTEGDFCEKVVECEDKIFCGHEAICIYNVEKRIAACQCNDKSLSFDPLDMKCKRDCRKSRCDHGGWCRERVSPPYVHDSQFCYCLKGTSGDLCQIVDECEGEPERCKGGSSCSFDIIRKEVFCRCPDENKKYDALEGKCKYTCNQDAQCLNGGMCMHRGGHLFCQCKEGISGTFCEIVDDCEQGICGFSNDTMCGFDIQSETVTCGCKDANSVYDPETKTCKEACDCGRNSISCSFEQGEKVCLCKEDFVDEDGTCKKKWCTEKSCFHGKCEIIDDEEVCSCYEGYELDGDYCKKLNCSETACINGTCIVRYGNVEECVCPAGYTLNRNTCIRGLCRIDTCYGGRCRKIDGELMCVCPDKFHLDGIGCYETVCEKQHCFGGKCVVEKGEEICTCPEGHILVKNVCKKIICEKKNCFGGQCHIVNGAEECTCLAGYFLFEDVCREIQTRE